MIRAPATSSGPSAGDVGRRQRQAGGPPDGLEHREVEARLLRERARRDVAVGAERALGGQQREPALGDGGAQLVERDAVRVQGLQQREPRRARVRVEALEQPSAAKSGALTPGRARRPARPRPGCRSGPRCR